MREGFWSVRVGSSMPPWVYCKSFPEISVPGAGNNPRKMWLEIFPLDSFTTPAIGGLSVINIPRYVLVCGPSSQPCEQDQGSAPRLSPSLRSQKSQAWQLARPLPLPALLMTGWGVDLLWQMECGPTGVS